MIPEEYLDFLGYSKGILLNRLYSQFRRNLDAVVDGSGDRTVLCVKPVEALCGFTMFFCKSQRIGHMYAANDQHSVILSKVTFCLRGGVPLTGRDSVRLPRAAKGPR